MNSFNSKDTFVGPLRFLPYYYLFHFINTTTMKKKKKKGDICKYHWILKGIIVFFPPPFKV